MALIRLLIDNGAKVNEKDNNGCSPLHWGIASGNKDSIRILLDSGGNINDKDNEGRTPIDIGSDRIKAFINEYFDQISFIKEPDQN